ncbi:MAG: hypothetical protein GY703_24855 [Gammaproteobacteria bacterium]|nr:hypothetical protein [Gammaproteobacteria bacterium]
MKKLKSDDAPVVREDNQQKEVSESRRRFTRAGLLASPILMSVAARPVFGVQARCLSNMLSGNLSHPSRGVCVTGFSPVAWEDELPDDPGDFSGWALLTFDVTIGTGSTDTFGEILRNQTGSDFAVFVAAYLNATEDPGAGDPGYILKDWQVVDLYAGVYDTRLAQLGTDKVTFLEGTW